jgi:hypothetical protein
MKKFLIASMVATTFTGCATKHHCPSRPPADKIVLPVKNDPSPVFLMKIPPAKLAMVNQ